MLDNDSGRIRVADVTIAQLSRGLYRSTATAFKELISNAFDADAKEVRIDTNYPEFDYISCVDTGAGMPIEKFINHFNEEGIGNSQKRKKNRTNTEIFNRPIIGRMGIGMLAIGQLCHSFEIESHYLDAKKKGHAYKGRIVLEDSDILGVDEIVKNNDELNEKIDVGTWSYELIDFDEQKVGFHIYSNDVRQTFRRDMAEAVRADDQVKKIHFDFDDLHKEFYDKTKKSIRNWHLYLETIWELSILCPLPYSSAVTVTPINVKEVDPAEKRTNEYRKSMAFLREKQEIFEGYNFKVYFDGIELKRLIQLPTDSDAKLSRLFFIDFDDTVFGRQLKFSGYLFSQIPKAITPYELNGIQIRVRGVGIGGYDSTFLRYYEQIDTIRSRWISGEIFVDEGLEAALNIDRDSFNEHDEHYKKLQKVVHQKLTSVFQESNRLATVLSDQKKEDKNQVVRNDLRTFVKDGSGGKFKLIEREIKNNEEAVFFDDKRKELIVNTHVVPFKRKNANNFYKAIQLAYLIAKKTSKSETERDEIFASLTRSIIEKLI